MHEDVLTGGFGGEVAAWAGEHCFARPRRTGRPGRRRSTRHVAYEPTLEDAILPQVDDVLAAILDTAGY